MEQFTKFTVVIIAATGLAATGVAAASPLRAQQAGPAVTIKDFMYNPAELAAKRGQPITITNNDGFVHSVTAKDGSFAIDVPANGTVTLTIPKAGSFPYSCTYHPGQHNPASFNVS